ncbi:MAG: tyrosine-protein phosphatase [Acidimicrobiia bacterium]
MDEIPLNDLAPGALWCASFSDVGPDPDAALAQAGADILVSLVETPEIHLRFPDFERWLDENPSRSRRHPIPDWGVVGDDELLNTADQLTGLVATGHKLILHCGAGMGRTGILSTLVLVNLGVPHAEAALHVRAHRGGAGPDSQLQREQLDRVAARIEAARA